MDFIIDHKRFKKKFRENELLKYSNKKNRVIKFPYYEKSYHNFFTSYAKEKYKLISNNCLCGFDNDILLSQTDRHCVNFITVACKSCGLIRAKEYYRNDDIVDFYKNHYRTKNYDESYIDKKPADFFYEQKKSSKFRYDLLEKYKIKPMNNLKIVDLGGGAGGILDHFDKSNERYLVDYFDPYLDYAKTKNIKIIKGGLEKIDFKPDVIVLSHVIEHWNNFDYEIKKLIKIQKPNSTLNYIEFPGIDSLKTGRREGDILGDIHVPHVYYFASYVFENLMNRYGFKKIYLDSLIKSIFIYTGEQKNLINYFDLCKKDLLIAEKARNIQIFKNIIKLFLPKIILKIIRRVRKKIND